MLPVMSLLETLEMKIQQPRQGNSWHACFHCPPQPPEGEKGKDVLELWNLVDVEPYCIRLGYCTVIRMAYSEQLGSIHIEILKYTDCTHFCVTDTSVDMSM